HPSRDSCGALTVHAPVRRYQPRRPSSRHLLQHRPLGAGAVHVARAARCVYERRTERDDTARDIALALEAPHQVGRTNVSSEMTYDDCSALSASARSIPPLALRQCIARAKDWVSPSNLYGRRAG